MRASAPLQVTIRRFGLWRIAVAVLLAISAGSVLAWALACGESAPPGTRAAGLAASFAIVVAGTGLMKCPPVSLRWDSERWHLGPESMAGEEPASGSIDVCLDFGAWMLLRFRPEAIVGRPHCRWVPVQRQGIDAHWHALRCAVYSSRPALDPNRGQTPARRPQSQE